MSPAYRPMIWYPLKILEESGFAEVIVVISETIKADFNVAVEKMNLKIELAVLEYPTQKKLLLLTL